MKKFALIVSAVAAQEVFDYEADLTTCSGSNYPCIMDYSDSDLLQKELKIDAGATDIKVVLINADGGVTQKIEYRQDEPDDSSKYTIVTER